MLIYICIFSSSFYTVLHTTMSTAFSLPQQVPHQVQIFETLLTSFIQDYSTQITNNKAKLDTLLTKTESMGYKLGQSIIERATFNLAPKNELDSIKYLCKVFWLILFNKEIDKLSTNRQGTYVLVDSKFQFHTAAWLPKRSKSDQKEAGANKSNLANRNKTLGQNNFKKPSDYSLLYVSFISGIIRGALCCLGHICLVTSEIEEESLVKFVVAVTTNQSIGDMEK